jgi:hypothetical protein
MIAIVFLTFLVLMAIGYGCSGVKEMDFIFEVKLYNNPYYKLGLSFDSYEYEEITVEEFAIGLFFVNLRFVFYKYDA